jgi:pimeloyl-ACP methyl ester carboxylesterase
LPARLVHVHRCPRQPRATCATLRVPLDHQGRTPGRLALAVAFQGPRRGPVLVGLSGGPGQPGVPFLASFRRWLGPAAARRRVVTFDQRGTGRGALRCPALQRAMGTSDLTVPPPAAVVRCARTLGERRRFFTTADTVEDIELLRRALGVPRIALDGVSYGTYVAERYALAHPRSVDRLVLDSVVPHAGLDALYADGLRATARVLRALCRAARCGRDPARDLAAVVRRRHDGPAILDAIVALSVFDPSFPGLLPALADARAGRPAALERLLATVRRGERAPALVLSQGLHAATLCGDLAGPWRSPAAPVAGRAAALRRAAAAVDPWPYDRATLTGNGLAQTCVRWPPMPAAPPPPADLPPVPVLLLAGDRDLSTPLEWARREAAHAPRGRLVVVHGNGHGVQRQASPAARRALAALFR